MILWKILFNNFQTKTSNKAHHQVQELLTVLNVFYTLK
jgi:hypothetical protein